jgi:hypothetical protein
LASRIAWTLYADPCSSEVMLRDDYVDIVWLLFSICDDDDDDDGDDGDDIYDDDRFARKNDPHPPRQ